MPTGPIVALTLQGPAAMDFRRQGVRRGLALPPRSLLVMDGEARLAWAHYIPHRKADLIAGQGWVPRGRRISLTFRQVLPSHAGTLTMLHGQLLSTSNTSSGSLQHPTS